METFNINQQFIFDVNYIIFFSSSPPLVMVFPLALASPHHSTRG